jgi:hypothetical protein
MLKKAIAPIVIAGALLGAAASAGTAYAAPTSTASASASASAKASGHPLRAWLRAHKKAIRKDVVAISSKTIGVTPQDLVSELRSGKSIAGVAAEHNVSAQTVENALVGAADAKINQAVTNHKLTSAQASQIEAALPGLASKVVNRTF